MTEKERLADGLSLAIQGIYFADNTEYLSYLWRVVMALDPDAYKLLRDDENRAYSKYIESSLGLESNRHCK